MLRKLISKFSIQHSSQFFVFQLDAIILCSLIRYVNLFKYSVRISDFECIFVSFIQVTNRLSNYLYRMVQTLISKITMEQQIYIRQFIWVSKRILFIHLSIVCKFHLITLNCLKCFMKLSPRWWTDRRDLNPAWSWLQSKR